VIAARCPWYIAGPIIGAVIIALRLTVNRPLGALGGYIDVLDAARGSRRLGFSAYLLIGTIVGGALFSSASGGHAITWWYQGAAAPLLLLGGLAMGFGARTAGGCTSGHGLSGMSLGSPASLAATMTFFATAVALANLVAWLAGSLR
jgi:uncharacterized membrane protein YedE/YeeE